MTEKENTELLLNAWTKICLWCKENLDGVFPNGFVAHAPFEPFGWTALAVTANGEAQYHTGSHGDSSTTAFTSEFQMEFSYGCAFGSCCVYSHLFHSSKTQPYDNQYYIDEFSEKNPEDCKMLDIENCRRLRIGCLGGVINLWPYFKQQLLAEKERLNSLKTFSA